MEPRHQIRQSDLPEAYLENRVTYFIYHKFKRYNTFHLAHLGATSIKQKLNVWSLVINILVFKPCAGMNTGAKVETPVWPTMKTGCSLCADVCESGKLFFWLPVKVGSAYCAVIREGDNFSSWACLKVGNSLCVTIRETGTISLWSSMNLDDSHFLVIH